MTTGTSKDGTVIAFDRSGKGPAVVVVGGVLGDRSQQAPLAALLAEHFTVFNYDRRVVGRVSSRRRIRSSARSKILMPSSTRLVVRRSSTALPAVRSWPSMRQLLGSPPRSRSWRCGNHHISLTTAVLQHRRIIRRSSPSCWPRVVEATWWNSS